MGLASKRILTELKDILHNPSTNCIAGPVDDDIFHWQGMITGPSDSPYENGIFFLDIDFPQTYPLDPPVFTFTTPVYHPNINIEGEICLDMLTSKWSPTMKISMLLFGIQSFLNEPDLNDSLVPEIADIYFKNRELYDRLAREWTEMHAM